MTRRVRATSKPGVEIVPASAPHALSTELSAALERAGAYARAALAPNTLRAYASDLRIFARWCRAHGQSAVPATPGAVAAFAADLASGAVPAVKPWRRAQPAHRPSSIGRYIAAIRYAHDAAGFDSPTTHPSVRAVLRGIRRTHGTARAKKRPAVAEVLRAMLAAIDDETPMAARDRAMVLLGFAGAFRRAALVALDWSDLEPRAGGLLVTIRRDKNDPEARGRVVHVHAAADKALCPVGALTALRATLDAQGWDPTSPGVGAIFRSLSPRSRGQRVGAAEVATAVKRAVEGAGLDPAQFAAHSLRSGFATEAARRGRSLDKIRAQTGHAGLDMLAEYLSPEMPWDEDAGSGLL